MAVTPDDVRHIAGLARLGVDEARLPELVRQLNGILGHMDALQRVAGQGAAAAALSLAPGMHPAPDQGPSDALARSPEGFAPAWRDGFFLVPRLATHDDAGEES